MRYGNFQMCLIHALFDGSENLIRDLSRKGIHPEFPELTLQEALGSLSRYIQSLNRVGFNSKLKNHPHYRGLDIVHPSFLSMLNNHSVFNDIINDLDHPFYVKQHNHFCKHLNLDSDKVMECLRIGQYITYRHNISVSELDVHYTDRVVRGYLLKGHTTLRYDDGSVICLSMASKQLHTELFQ